MAASGAPRQSGLEYFPKMVNFYDDDKIFDLLDEYGPLGVTIYDCILTIVYSNGYFANLSKDKLSRMVIRKIGNKWIKSQKVVVQVIDYCADLGLLSKDLMLQDIITSEGIQKRYYKIAVKLMKRRLYSTEYWLLDKNGEPLLSARKIPVSSEESPIVSEEIDIVSEDIRQKEKERKQKEINNNSIPDGKPSEGFPEASFEMQCTERLIMSVLSDLPNSRVPKTDAEKKKWVAEFEKMQRLDGRSREQIIQALDYAVQNSFWRSNIRSASKFRDKFETLYLQSCDRKKKQSEPKKRSETNRFHNFEQRDTDYDSMVQQQVMGWLKEDKTDEV